MKSLWHSLFSTLFHKGSAAPPTEAPARARSASTIPAGVFDRRPVVACNTPHGLFCLPADFANDAAARAIADGASVPAELLDLIQPYVTPGSVVLDIGAGFGRMLPLFSGLVGPAGQVLAFEADEYLCEVLQHTVKLNCCENVRVFFGAVYDGSRERVTFPSTPSITDAAYSGQRIDPDGVAGTLPAHTIDKLRIEAPVSFMYIDTNGCELNVLRGAVETITRLRMTIALEFHPTLAAAFGATQQDLTAFFENIGYAVAGRHNETLYAAVPQDKLDAGSSGASFGAIAIVHPDIKAPALASASRLCKLLQDRAQIDSCTQYLKRFGYVPHNLTCKNWDLAHIIPAVGDGNFLDMGSSDSYILKNLALKRIRGELYGIDLRVPDVPISTVKYLVGDLMHTPLPDRHFANIACLSVLEHQVEYDKFAAEAARLLAPGGRVFVTFDYWDPKITPLIKLYELDWMPLDAAMVRRFIESCERQGLSLVEPFDFTLGDPVINWGYYSPHPDISYTFGMAVFVKH